MSYWRRILQARLDVVREAGTTGAGASTHASAAPAADDPRASAPAAGALVSVLPARRHPAAAEPGRAVGAPVEPDDEAGLGTPSSTTCAAAEQELSAYRSALHGRLGEATGELIARYREQPALCLSALPLAAAARSPRRDRPAGVSGAPDGGRWWRVPAAGRAAAARCCLLALMLGMERVERPLRVDSVERRSWPTSSTPRDPRRSRPSSARASPRRSSATGDAAGSRGCCRAAPAEPSRRDVRTLGPPWDTEPDARPRPAQGTRRHGGRRPGPRRPVPGRRRRRPREALALGPAVRRLHARRDGLHRGRAGRHAVHRPDRQGQGRPPGRRRPREHAVGHGAVRHVRRAVAVRPRARARRPRRCSPTPGWPRWPTPRCGRGSTTGRRSPSSCCGCWPAGCAAPTTRSPT